MSDILTICAEMQAIKEKAENAPFTQPVYILPETLVEKAHEALCAMVPRLMTIEEVKEASKRMKPVYIEYYDPDEEFPDEPYTMQSAILSNVKYYSSPIVWIVAVIWTGARFHFNPADYGKTWRCWTGDATDEQRKKEAWNDGRQNEN